MTKCTDGELSFGRIGRLAVQAAFDGGDIGSDGGALLLRRVDERLGLCRRVAAVLTDPRDPSRIRHTQQDMVRQRVFGLALGYEDLNDHGALRTDTLLQTAVGRDEKLASAPTLCRLEGRADRAMAWALHGVLRDLFVESFAQPPQELVLDFDASDVPLHGMQQGRFFHGYYDHYCYLPLYVFCGERLLACVLRPSNRDGAYQAAAVLKLLVKRLRQVWPGVRIVLRGDSGFCRRRLMNWCERNTVSYVIGLARNARLHERVALVEQALEEEYRASGEKQREIGEFAYAAGSWKSQRRVVTRLEYGAEGTNPRFVVTNLTEPAAAIYDERYCARGEAENRIKEVQLGLFGTRASGHRMAVNQLRLLFSALAYTRIVAACAHWPWRAPRWRARRPPRSACGCSRSARQSCVGRRRIPRRSATAARAISRHRRSANRC
jgi:hypothetical protein